MATSMRPRTGTPTPTPGAAGRVQARTLTRNTTHPATPAQAPEEHSVPVAGEGRKRAADHRPSIAAAEAGRPGSPVLAAHTAGAVVVAGEAAGEPDGRSARETTWMSDGVEVSDNPKVWRIGMSQAARRISFTTWLMLLALIVSFAGCKKSRRSLRKQRLLHPTTQAMVC